MRAASALARRIARGPCCAIPALGRGFAAFLPIIRLLFSMSFLLPKIELTRRADTSSGAYPRFAHQPALSSGINFSYWNREFGDICHRYQ
jgi:hypothetical protein